MLMLLHRSLYLGVRVAALPAFNAPPFLRLLLLRLLLAAATVLLASGGLRVGEGRCRVCV